MYLEHHGIKGMRWGVRRFERKNTTRKISNRHDESKKAKRNRTNERKKSKHQIRLEKKYQAKGMTAEEAEKRSERRIRNQKRAVIVGASIAAVYLGYKLVDSGVASSYIDKGRARLKGISMDEFLGGSRLNNKKSNKFYSSKEILDNVVSDINPSYLSSPGTTNNCLRCSYAYELSRRGYDVQARRTLRGSGQSPLAAYNSFRDKKIRGTPFSYSSSAGYMLSGNKEFKYRLGEIAKTQITIPKELDTISKKSVAYGENIFKTLAKEPTGARGELSVYWPEGMGGHSLAWEIVKGKPVVFDCQRRQMYESGRELGDSLKHISGAVYQRLDDKELDLGFLSRWVKPGR